MKNRHELLNGFPIVISLPVQWGDEDAFGHVNNTMYFRWFESVRVAYLEKIGLWQKMSSDGVGPILASISCNFRLALRYPDTIHIGAKVPRIGRTSFRMEHRIVSEAEGAVGAEGDSTIVVLNYPLNKPQPMPDRVRRAIEELEGRTFPEART
jgi:acyl-CoA thioester hydrolase